MREHVVATFGSWPEAQGRAAVATDAGAGKLEIILSGDSRVGILHLEWMPDHLSLEKLFILPEFQRCGIGSWALQAVLSRAQHAHLRVRLRVLKVNPAKALYGGHGFRVVSETRERYFMEHAA